MPGIFPWKRKAHEEKKAPCRVTNEDLLQEIRTLKEHIYMAAAITQKEIADGITALRSQNAKIAAEQAARFDACTARIKELEDAINAGGQASDEVVAALAGLKADMQAFDDVIPDAPTPA